MSLRLCAGFAVAALITVMGGVGFAAAANTPEPPPTPAYEYRLGPGDKLRVTTFGEEALTGEFFVGTSGRVSLPLVGEIAAVGKTAREFQSEVETVLKDGYIREPRVSVEVLTYRPFYILGEVGRPGEYPYTSSLTVLNAVATANGFTYRANTKRVFIKRATETVEHEYPLTATTIVAPGDTIRIVERLF